MLSPSTATATSSVLNPWATTKPMGRQNAPSVLYDNPWNIPSDSTSSVLRNTLVDSPIKTSPDPHMALPTAVPAPRQQESAMQTSSSVSSSLTEITMPSPFRKTDDLPTEKKSDSSNEIAMDPLGVGVW